MSGVALAVLSPVSQEGIGEKGFGAGEAGK